jgi:uncharacterized protein (DUF1778 family)
MTQGDSEIMATMTETEQGYARLSCRVKVPIKRRAEEAAGLLGLSITDFTEEALEEKAQVVFERHEKIILSKRDFERFVEIIENPQPPTPELVAAMQEYQTLKEQNPGGNW